MTPNEIEQLPARCVEHVRRLDRLEGRVDSVEARISGIEELKTLVQLLADRMRLIIWLSGICTGSIVVAIIGKVFEGLL